MILTPQRLTQIASNPKLADLWYLIAAVTMTVCNKPHEIPTIYHYAMHLQRFNVRPSEQLYSRVQSVVKNFEEIKDRGQNAQYTPYGDAVDRVDAASPAFVTSEKFRESILKTSALSGLPKAINALTVLKDTTPWNLRRHDPTATNRKPIRSYADYTATQQRGQEFWNAVYTKVSSRIIGQMASSYPDLWQYAIQDVYADLLSYCGVLSHEETSIIVVSCLIPQDVNPQLKGHLKGALNTGVDRDVLVETRALALTLSRWCGVEWETDVAEVR